MSANITDRTLSGMVWAYASYWGRRIFNLLTTAILARVLVPEDFGLISLGVLLITFIDELKGFGVNEALVYNDQEKDLTADSAFWFNTVFGLLQFLLLFALAPLGLRFTDDPQIVPVIRALSITLLITGVGKTHETLLRKDLAFRRSFGPEIWSALVKGIVSVTMALMGYGVWAMVFGQVVGAAARTIMVAGALPWVPRLRFSFKRLTSLWNFGIFVMSISLIDVALAQADQLLIAVMLGTLQLGYYTIGARIPELVIANFSVVLTSVLFPAYSSIKDDLGLLVKGILVTTRYTVLVTVGAGLGLVAIAPDLVPVLFGPQWGPSVPLLQVLAVMGILMTIPWAVGDGLKAVGRPDITTWLMLIEVVYTFGLIYLATATWRTALAASGANAVSVGITAVIRLAVACRIFKIKPMEFAKAFVGPFIAGGLMLLALIGWRIVAAPLGSVVVLISSVVIGAGIYVGLLFVLARPDLIAVRDTIQEALRRRMNKASAAAD